MKDKIVSISSINTDYYAWGRNCALLGYNRDVTMNVLFYPFGGNISKENEDLFWEGYYENLPKIKLLPIYKEEIY